MSSENDLNPLFTSLPPGPLDIVGDVHGEIEPLRALMAHLGYDPIGRHTDGRRLVFVGDLTDRGPDSPAVLGLVRRLVEADRARCVLGNHELNLLRRDRKDGNGWAYALDHDRQRGRYGHSRGADERTRSEFMDFFRTLPLALERTDLRVVHACWSEPAVARLRSEAQGAEDLAGLFRHYEDDTARILLESGLQERAQAQEQAHAAALEDPAAAMPMLDAVAQADELRQMNNPLRILTSGIERQGRSPFFTSGKWRFVERVAWWDEYAAAVPVVVGHYWRWPVKIDRASMDKDGPDLFAGAEAGDWLGPLRNVYCVDFSVGRRFRERELGMAAGSQTRLAALRWPERRLVFDDGVQQATA
jgi:hypothetical protein